MGPLDILEGLTLTLPELPKPLPYSGLGNPMKLGQHSSSSPKA